MNDTTTQERIAPGDLARASLGKHLLAALAEEIRALPDVWQKLPAERQAETLDRLTARIQYEVGRAVQVLAAGSYPRLVALVDSVTFKDGCKLVLKLGSENAAVHDLIEAQGSNVLVTICDPEQFLADVEGSVQPDADEPELAFGTAASPGGTDPED